MYDYSLCRIQFAIFANWIGLGLYFVYTICFISASYGIKNVSASIITLGVLRLGIAVDVVLKERKLRKKGLFHHQFRSHSSKRT